jgi:hypothetical protein
VLVKDIAQLSEIALGDPRFQQLTQLPAMPPAITLAPEVGADA